MHWCPYVDRDLPETATNLEHIIPLALGGANAFCIRVEKEFNAQAGSSIDGALAKDFLTSIRRRNFDTRGHSNKPPKVVLRNSSLGDVGRPVQVTLRGSDDPIVWDAMKRRTLQKIEYAGQQISSRLRIGSHDRIRFLAKVALASGYKIYGDLFRRFVQHQELRAVMNIDSSTSHASFEGFEIRGYDEFTQIEEKDQTHARLDKFFCQIIAGSCVLTIPGPQNIGFVVGILGKWVGTLNVPAITESFPFEGEHDLGHVVLVEDGRVSTMSYRQLAQRANAAIEKSEVELD